MEHDEARQKHTACRRENPGSLFPRDVKHIHKRLCGLGTKKRSYLGCFVSDSGVKAGLGEMSVRNVCQRTKKTFLVTERLSICFKISSKIR